MITAAIILAIVATGALAHWKTRRRRLAPQAEQARPAYEPGEIYQEESPVRGRARALVAETIEKERELEAANLGSVARVLRRGREELQQTMTDSPGGIQARGDVRIYNDARQADRLARAAGLTP